MNILIVSKDGDTLDLALRLRREGHTVRFAVCDADYRRVGSGFDLQIEPDWRSAVPWVGAAGLIIFDQSGWGTEQDELRKAGYSVVGGCAGADKLEFERCNAQQLFRQCGIQIVRSKHFTSADEAIRFISNNKGRWVVKQNGHADKCFSYAGRMPDASDVLDLLHNYRSYNRAECTSVDIQERITGVEIGCARYFNGTDWVGPIEMNLEHKNLFPGGLGPKTPEMGTLIWYDDNENNKLFCETLAKLAPHLKKINFRGDIDINCIVNEQGAFPLEATPRFGYPAIHSQSLLHKSPWGDFLKAVADGTPYHLRWRRGFCVVILVGTPPFPYCIDAGKYNPEGLTLNLHTELTPEEQNRLHFSEIRQQDGKLIVAASSGYVMAVTGRGLSVQQAQRSAYDLVRKLCLPRMFYRDDIGAKFIAHDRALLKKWGYV